MSSGFRDKLYWRFGASTLAHCFKKSSELRNGPRGWVTLRVWVSLCGRATLTRSRGQAVERPEPRFRCGRCDGLEMERRGWDESGPTTMSA